MPDDKPPILRAVPEAALPRDLLANGARSFGEIAESVVEKMRERVFDDVACEGPRIYRVLREAALSARHRGAKVSLIPQGFLVQATGKAEIVLWEQADVGVLERALMRVAPTPAELAE